MNVVIAPIVEGHAEQVNGNLNSLLCRLWLEHLKVEYPPLVVLRASRGTKATLVEPERHADLRTRIGEANYRLQERLTVLGGGVGMVLLILDGDEDCLKLDRLREKKPDTPKLGPKLVAAAQQQCPHIPDFACVIAVKEFENWLLAGAKGFVGNPDLKLPADFDVPNRPDEMTGAGWFAKQRIAAGKALGHAARHHIGGASGRKRHDQAQRLVRKGGAGQARQEQQACRQ